MEKNLLPIKTKIAAWWMIVGGMIFIFFGVIGEMIKPSPIPLIGRLLVVSIMSLSFLLSICGGVFLLKMKKWAWVFSIISILIVIVFSFSNLEEHFIWKLIFFSGIFILILLFLDRKNFWKIAI